MLTRRVLLALLCVCSLTLAAWAQNAPPAGSGPRPRLGMNLNGPTDWNTELPFVDVFRQSRAWISQRQGAGWGKGPELQLDEHGWVKQLEEGCWAETPLCTIAGGHYPAGRYTVLYEGEGEIVLMSPAKAVEQQPGRIIAEVDSSRNGFFLQIRKTNPQNYIRNIRMIMPGFEKSYEKEPFHPAFLKHWQGVACFRFMDWMHTNGSKVKTWADRPKMDDATWTNKGIPVEVMVDLCNRQKADMWVCMPEMADDGYVKGFAELVKAKLDPSLKVYIEYSNEVWNGQFASNRWAAQKAKELGMGDPARPWEGACLYYGKRSLEMFAIWQKAFGGTDRLVRTLAWQAASGPYWLDGMLLSHLDAKQVDALAIAPYITFLPRPGGKEQAGNSDEVGNWTVEQVLDHAEQVCLPQLAKWMQQAAEVAKKYNVKLVCYEAGQHLVGVGGGENNDKLTKLFHEANAHPRMGEIYSKYYKAWEDAGGDLLCHFSSISNWSKWGSWGLIEYYDQGAKDSPKLAATIKWAKEKGQKVGE